jgi:hypothetical protein
LRKLGGMGAAIPGSDMVIGRPMTCARHFSPSRLRNVPARLSKKPYRCLPCCAGGGCGSDHEQSQRQPFQASAGCRPSRLLVGGNHWRRHRAIGPSQKAGLVAGPAEVGHRSIRTSLYVGVPFLAGASDFVLQSLSAVAQERVDPRLLLPPLGRPHTMLHRILSRHSLTLGRCRPRGPLPRLPSPDRLGLPRSSRLRPSIRHAGAPKVRLTGSSFLPAREVAFRY